MRRATCNVVIIGGGIAGLWCRALLEREERSVILVEKHALGAGQSVASQGIIHAGLKYEMSGEGRGAARLLRDGHALWLERLAGETWPDLSGTRILARRCVNWTTLDLASRSAALVAERLMQAGARRLPPGKRPAAFEGAPRNIDVRDVDEPAIDARTLIADVAAAAHGPMLHGAPTGVESHAEHVLVTVDCGGDLVEIRADTAILAAGLGNESLLQTAGIDPACQARPLHMVIARGDQPPIFGHCVQPSKKPRVTITSADHDGDTIWYVGGGVSEPPATERSPGEQIEHARRELQICLPWLDMSRLEFSTLMISRAEGRTAGGGRPEGPVVQAHGRVIAVWPTKLALAPAAADMVARELQTQLARGGELSELAGLPAPPIASPVWGRS